jgi:hypothetical protein
MRSTVRAAHHDIKRMTGGSHTKGGQAPVHHEKIGDHRKANMHSGPATSSAIPMTPSGTPMMPMQGGDDGPQAA